MLDWSRPPAWQRRPERDLQRPDRRGSQPGVRPVQVPGYLVGRERRRTGENGGLTAAILNLT